MWDVSSLISGPDLDFPPIPEPDPGSRGKKKHRIPDQQHCFLLPSSGIAPDLRFNHAVNVTCSVCLFPMPGVSDELNFRTTKNSDF